VLLSRRCLDEIDAGMCDGLTYDEVAQQFPDEYKKRKVRHHATLSCVLNTPATTSALSLSVQTPDKVAA
jgi:broad specificity phosphatase PhoE